MTTHEAPAKYDKPLPVIHPDNKPYWDSIKAHQVKMQKCSDCGTVRFPVSPVCYKCFSWNHTWVPLSGKGKVGSWIVVAQATGNPVWSKDVPYNVALVDLEEGPRVTSNILQVNNDDIYTGMPVEAIYDDVTPEVSLLKFKPAAGATRK